MYQGVLKDSYECLLSYLKLLCLAKNSVDLLTKIS